jgi:diguanylate cyclase (GGDEF)-like protein
MDIKRLKNDAAFDPLTNCYNRREFNRLIEHQIAHSHRYEKPLSLIMFDIDHFKRINDTHGHPAGDKVLQIIAGLIKNRIRKGDYLVRYGGEEFVVVLPETRLENALKLAEQLRQLIATTPVQIGSEAGLTVTASFGVSALDHSAAVNHQHLVKKADEMLYKAKTNGRNQVMPTGNSALIKSHKRVTDARQQGNLIPFEHLAHAGS